ncbi:hypothetical protein Pcinc_014870 [Petrolisthes cinctipes]|uniref:Uncharacterized protein n=1 Tax=Petrolisthes cinctipes TaxID=88211 RepID=A0AAE1KNS1_PETCI|nr:hypothetical protein Pcinc_014870 [Petrolisthes cinctipes]
MIQEPDRQWGTDTNGVFDGVSGYLQREEVDFSAIAAPSAPRMKVANFIRSYPVDNLIIVSLQPQPLPKNLAFVRPFTATITKERFRYVIQDEGMTNLTFLGGWEHLATESPDQSLSMKSAN